MSEQIKCIKCGSIKVGLNKAPNSYKCRECGKYFTLTMDTPTKVHSIMEPLSKLEVTFNIDDDKLRTIPLGDIHVGSNQCKWDKVNSELNYILNTKYCSMIGMGDFCDMASKEVRKGPSVFESVLSPMQQYEKIYDAFKPLADAGKIIGLLKGNHEQWINEDSGIDIMAMLCMALKVPYLGSACDIVINVNDQRYVVYAQHGSSSAKLSSTKMGSLMNATRDIFADLFLYGHVHQVSATKCSKWVEGKEQKAYYVLTGHFLDWQGGYAQTFGISPSPTGVAKISLFADRKDIHVSI
jgi:hypothetical protein